MLEADSGVKAGNRKKSILVIQLVTIVGLTFFWIGYLVGGKTPGNRTAYAFNFDAASPFPDVCLGMALILSGYLLMAGHKPGRYLSMLCALYLAYLGVIDRGIALDGKIYALSIIDIASNGFVNLWCIVMGLYMLLMLRRGKSFNKF